MKKFILKIPAYYLLFGLLALSEQTLGLYGLAAATAFALLYCREKPYLFLPGFIGAAISVSRSLPVLISTASVTVTASLLFFLHHKKKWKFKLWETALASFLNLAPHVALSFLDPVGIAAAVLSAGVSVALHYVSVVGLFPLFVRGIRHPKNGNEKFCMGLLAVALSVGVSTFRPFSVNVLCILYAFCLIPLCALDRSFVLPFGVCAGTGAAIGLYDPTAALYLVLPALATYCLSRQRFFLRAAASAATFFLTTAFFFGSVDLYSVLPYLGGSLLSLCLPDKFVKKFAEQDRSSDRFALRTVVNRDRESLAEKLLGVSDAFVEMRDVLLSEQPVAVGPESIVKAVCEKCCVVCPEFRDCAREVGDLAVPVRKLVHVALGGTKASILDADASLGKNCQKLPYLLRAVNEETDLYRDEIRRKKGLERSKQTIIAELGSVAGIARQLASSVSVNVTFDPSTERKLIERLAKSNVVAEDVCIYEDGAEKEVSVLLREKDADKTALPVIVSDTVGIPMSEFSRKKEINGEMSLHFCRAPDYKILYGESFSSRDNRCGDTRQAVKIDNRRSLFILSDGMGTGEKAKETATRVGDLVETFYRAGFSHEAVFFNVSQLLSLRSREDFSALDAVIVDVRTAEADFIKQGGRESYLFSGDGYEVIEGDSLPVGIVETAPTTVRKKLRPDDLIVLMSDGVADALTPSEVAQVVRSVPAKNPKAAADALLENALRLTKKPDDMTVVCMRVVRCPNDAR